MSPSRKQSLRRLWPGPIAALCLLYAAGLLGFFAVRALLPYRPPLLALLDAATPFLFTPLILTLPLAILSRRRRAAILAGLAPLGLFAMLYGPLFLPRPRPPATPNAVPLSVMTFNLWAEQGQVDAQLAAIAGEDADVVAVQELVGQTAEALQTKLADSYPYTILDLGKGTNGLLSRYPIVKSEWFQPGEIWRPAIHAVLDVHGTPVHVFVVHPMPPGFTWHDHWHLPTGLTDQSRQERQMAGIAERVAALDEPVVVMGDLNTSDRSRAYATLAAVLIDAHREAGRGFGFTFPYGIQLPRGRLPGPFVRLDYVFHSPDLYAEQVHVGCGAGSDHCYLVARLNLPPGGR